MKLNRAISVCMKTGQRRVYSAVCRKCKDVFYRPDNNRIEGFCTLRCGQYSFIEYNCKQCNKVTLRRPCDKMSLVFCSRRCTNIYRVGPNNPTWKGGWIHNGYKRIMSNGKCVYEHRNVLEKNIGRKLLRSEDVHHIDKNRTNNSINNLQVIDHKEHARIHKLQSLG